MNWRKRRPVPEIAEGSIWQLLPSDRMPAESACSAMTGYWHVLNTAAEFCRYHSRNRGIAARVCKQWRDVVSAR